MNPFDKFPIEIAMQIVKMTPHPVADILQTSWRENRERIRREMEEEDRRAWQNHYWRYYHIYRYI